MKRVIAMGILAALFMMILSACGNTGATKQNQEAQNMPSNTIRTEAEEDNTVNAGMRNSYTVDTAISDVIHDPVFGDYGRLIFPVDAGYYSGDTLGELQLTWYNNIDSEETVEITSYMREHAASGDVIFYDIYTEEEKSADPAKEDTGLFFFKGNPGERFAICNAGGRLPMWVPCRTAFPMLWSCPGRDITHLP